MSVVAKDVFIMAMNLMDEQSEDGTYSGYPNEYKSKSWTILTVLQSELLPQSSVPLAITNETNVLQIDDRTAITTLPYGLAAHLLVDEDQDKAAFFNARYDELKSRRPATSYIMKDSYWEGGKPNESSNQPDYDGGSFLDKDSGVYDGGEF